MIDWTPRWETFVRWSFVASGVIVATGGIVILLRGHLRGGVGILIGLAFVAFSKPYAARMRRKDQERGRSDGR